VEKENISTRTCTPQQGEYMCSVWNIFPKSLENSKSDRFVLEYKNFHHHITMRCLLTLAQAESIPHPLPVLPKQEPGQFTMKM
jgi:hypothetical protein